MTKERIEEVRDKYLYICDNVAAKYNLDEDGKQDLVLYYLELCQDKPDMVRKGSYRLYGYLYSRAERILRRREREAVRECSIEECELYDDSISQVEDKVWGESLSEEIEQLLPTLAPREIEVVRTVTMGGETQVECGRALGLTKERIRQIEAKALRKLRHPSRSKYLKPFLVTTVPKNRVRNEKPSYKFVYDTPWLRPVPCEHAHGKNFGVKIYESDGYVIWVEGQRNGGYVNGKEFRLCSREQGEDYIVKRLSREKRCGKIEKIDDNTYRFTADVYDSNEMITWIRTFIGRIKKIKCDNPEVVNQLKFDIVKMAKWYEVM